MRSARVNSFAVEAPEVAQTLRLAEVIGALSFALDLTEGQPPGHCLRCCWIGFHVGRALGLDEEALWDLYYTLLLKDAGCSSNAERLYELYAHDDLAVKRNFKTVDTDSLRQLGSFVFKHAGLGKGMAARLRSVGNLLMHGEQLATDLIVTRCERGAQIALDLGFSGRVAAGIHSLDEHWNGRGRPERLAGDAIPLGARIALLAQVVDVFHHEYGVEAALGQVRLRRGTWFDPAAIDALERVAEAPAFWRTLRAQNLAERVFALEPASRSTMLDDARLDAIAAGFARVVDAKSHFTFGHSARVAEYSELLAAHLGMDAPGRRWLKRGALLHDIGKLGVSNAVLNKSGSLSEAEWEKVKAHPRYTEEILSRITPFRELALVAGAHHERLDGQGYPRGLDASRISLPTRIITTADILDAITAERPYRAAVRVPQALEMMEKLRGTALAPECLDALHECLPLLGLSRG
jgi:HD-GYP domain-containing protein (c-di-GMP phosphodiesterase class II)